MVAWRVQAAERRSGERAGTRFGRTGGRWLDRETEGAHEQLREDGTHEAARERGLLH
jgi:hypothetical protein